MNIKITAEFDSVDSADFAIKAINNSDCKIENMTVKAPLPDADINYVSYLFPLPTEAVNVPNFLPAIFNDNIQFRFYNDNVSLGKPEISKSAVMELTCNEKYAKEIRKIILNNKGLKIHIL